MGQTQCQKCIKESSNECLICSYEIFNKADLETINGESYLLCDKSEKYHNSVCNLFCRGKFQPFGKCEIVNHMPLCICQQNPKIISFTTDSLIISSISKTNSKSTTSVFSSSRTNTWISVESSSSLIATQDKYSTTENTTITTEVTSKKFH